MCRCERRVDRCGLRRLTHEKFTKPPVPLGFPAGEKLTLLAC